jgi:hypothetical protein
MTKGVPSKPRSCVRCGKSYQPASGSQRYCIQCRPIMKKVYTSEWSRRNPRRRRQISQRAKDRDPVRTRQLKRFNFYRWKEKHVVEVLVLGHYSNGSPACACCSESERDFLVIDHIEGHGNEHRRQIFGRAQSGWRFYSWLVKQGFPTGFQVLCFNCNMSKAKHGKCVHVAKPVPPLPPVEMKSIKRSPDLRPRGDEALLVRWNPRKKLEGQTFKGSLNAGKIPG